MEGSYFITDLQAQARFSSQKPTKQDCFNSDRLFVGLNCLATGQSQPVHSHESQDKFYLVVSGKARIIVGTETQELSAGGIAWAPAGVPHGVEFALEDTILLVTMSPPPKREAGRGKREE